MTKILSFNPVAWLKTQKWTCKKVIVCMIGFIVFFNEILIYCVWDLAWPAIKPYKGPSRKEVRIMLVADPQILGYVNEPPFLQYITIWDGDRYLRNTFLMAYQYIQPEIIIFLGDLFDEGSTATGEDYEYTFKRFNDIFPIESSVQTLYLHGDNDVGGESTEAKTPMKVHRFENHFGKETGVINKKFLDIIKINLDFKESATGSSDKKAELIELVSHLSTQYRIFVNHHSLLDRYKYQIYPVVHLLQPHLIFSAHSHEAKTYTCYDCREQTKEQFKWSGLTEDNLPTQMMVDIRDPKQLVDIAVPTCSYRMGVPRMGYASAIINDSGILEYTVLWLPKRYMQLMLYIAILPVCVAALFCNLVFKRFRR